MQDGPTISNLPEGHNLTTSTVVVTSPAATITPGSPLVKVLIKYPTDWKKDKFFKDGDIKEVSPEAAATFIEIGIASMHDETNEQAVADEQPEAEETESEEATEEEQPTTEGKKPKKSK
jgi:hypothetical protein